MKIVSSEIMRSIDEQTISSKSVSGETLMYRAGCGAADAVSHYLQTLSSPHRNRLVIICGRGNNGGDGLVIAAQLNRQIDVCLILTHKLADFCGDAALMASRLPPEITLHEQIRDLSPLLRSGDIIVDCLFGTGLTRNVGEPYNKIIADINSSASPVISIDIPSGLHGSSGLVLGCAVKADLCLTIGLPKSGFFASDAAAEHCGLLRCIDIGFPKPFIDSAPSEGEAFFASDAAVLLGRRSRNSHKYSHGRVLIIGGSSQYDGAPVLSATAALRSGAGMVTVARPLASWSPPQPSPAALIHLPLHDESKKFSPEHLPLIANALSKTDIALIGPGMCGDPLEKEIMNAALQSGKTCIFDAGALMHLPNFEEQVREHPRLILTPHCGELRQLAKALQLASEESELQLARQISTKLQVYLVLKGRFSRTFSPKGQSIINSSGSPALATAGSGDCLGGIIAALTVNQADLLQAVATAVFIHGRSAELSCRGDYAFIADDIPEFLPKTFKDLSPFA